MLVIRNEQLNAFVQAAAARFEARAAAHLARLFPLHCAILGERAVREVVGYGVVRGERHGLTVERDLFLHLKLMMMLGSHFDDDPQLSWVGAILRDATLSDPTERIRLVHEQALGLLDRLLGAENEHLHRALLRIRACAFLSWPYDPGQSFEEQASLLLRQIHPEKWEAIGEAAVRRLCAAGREGAARHAVTDARGAAIFVLLMFMLGSAFDVDPQFPWAAAALHDTPAAAQEARVRRLHDAAMAYLEELLQSSGLSGEPRD